MNMTQLLTLMQSMNISGKNKIPTKEELEEKMKNLKPEEKEKINLIMNSDEFQNALKTNDLKAIISAVQKVYKKS